MTAATLVTDRNVRRRLARAHAWPGRRYAREVMPEAVVRARENDDLAHYVDVYAKARRSMTLAVARGEWPTRKEQQRRDALREALFTPWQTDGRAWWRAWRTDPAPVVLVEFLRVEKNTVLDDVARLAEGGKRLFRALYEEAGVDPGQVDPIVDDLARNVVGSLDEESLADRERWRVRTGPGAASGPAWDEQLFAWTEEYGGSLDDGRSLGDAWIAGRLGDAFAERAERESAR